MTGGEVDPDPIWATTTISRPQGRTSRTPRPPRHIVHLPQGCMAHTPWLSATEEDRSGARCRTRHIGSHVSGRRRVSEGPDPYLPQRPKIHPVARLGGLNERPTAGRRDGFRGGTSDPSQCEPHSEMGGGAAPGGTPVCPRPTPRVQRGGAPDIQQLPGQPGCGVGTSPAS
jgi:hypothetical protein